MVNNDEAHKLPAHIQDKARDWLVLLASGDISSRDQKRLETWLLSDPDHKKAFAQEQSIWQQTSHIKDAFDPSTWALDDADRMQVTEVPLHQHNNIFRMKQASFAGLGLAACLLLMLFAGDIRIWLSADYRTASGEEVRITLPDGSIAHLNTDSAIAVDYSRKERSIVLLRGETYFTVAKNAAIPFVVHSQDRTVTAVGTAFAVRDNDGEVSVTVTSGKIEVAPLLKPRNHSMPIKLTVNQQVIYQDGGAVSGVQEVETGDVLGWRDGKIIINNMPFYKAISELDRYRPGHIIIASTSKNAALVSGVFSKDRLDSAINVLAATQGLTVQHMTPYLMILH